MPLVSIGLPFYNASATLSDAIRSVLVQSTSDWELLLVDDGSTDGSLDVAQSVGDRRIKIMSDGSNKGLAVRLNEITRRATGHYVARMDSDDLMHPRRIARQLEYLRENTKLDVVGTTAYVINEANEIVGLRGSSSEVLDVIANRGLIHPTIVGKNEWFAQNPYDPDYYRAEDCELWCRTLGRSTFGVLHEPLYFYREAPGSSLHRYRDSHETYRRILRRYGPGLVGRTQTSRLVLKSRMRSSAYAVAWAVGLAGFWVRRRSRRLGSAESAKAQSVVRSLLARQPPVTE